MLLARTRVGVSSKPPTLLHRRLLHCKVIQLDRTIRWSLSPANSNDTNSNRAFKRYQFHPTQTTPINPDRHPNNPTQTTPTNPNLSVRPHPHKGKRHQSIPTTSSLINMRVDD